MSRHVSYFVQVGAGGLALLTPLLLHTNFNDMLALTIYYWLIFIIAAIWHTRIWRSP